MVTVDLVRELHKPSTELSMRVIHWVKVINTVVSETYVSLFASFRGGGGRGGSTESRNRVVVDVYWNIWSILVLKL